MIDPDRILFIPSTRRGNGTGHLKRCLEWGADLKVQHLFSLDHHDGEDVDDNRNHPLFKKYPHIQWHENPGKDWDLIILDNRQTDSLPRALTGVPVIAVDESGKMRNTASYTLDILPTLSRRKPNFVNFNFFNGPEKTRPQREILRILVTFGGEDPASLGIKVLKSLTRELFESYEWTFLIPDKDMPERPPRKVMVLPYIENLREELWTYDLVITSYGLTSLEARAAHVDVILLNPGKYHDRLSLQAGYTFLKRGYSRSPRRILNFLIKNLDQGRQSAEQDFSPSTGSKDDNKETFMNWLASMTISSETCPVCGSIKRKNIGRFPGKSYFLCGDCRMKYMVQFRQKEEIYSKDYFFSEYKAQYGRTYLDDFPHIQQMAEERLKRINRVSGNILDVGCAYGPFLLKAHDWGLTPRGLEISPDAVEYIKDNYPQLRVEQGAFEKSDIQSLKENSFDVMTFWYVIEHFQKLDTVLTRANLLLKSGGVLALSTPHASGVSGIFRLQDFLSKSPEDHFTLWDRRSARRALKLYGFKNIRFHITGHHPERFPAAVQKLFPQSGLLAISRILGWGDTFEIYAEKG